MPPAASNSAPTSDEEMNPPPGGTTAPAVAGAPRPLPVWILLAFAAIAGCASSGSRVVVRETFPPPAEGRPAATAPRVEAVQHADRGPVLAKIMSLMGVPYTFNGTDTTGFDCSGFTAAVFASTLQRTLPHSSQGQFTLGAFVDRDSLQFGDLVFFADGGDEPSHVGIYVGDGLFAHASVSLGVTVSLLENSYYKKRYLGSRRLTR